MPDNTADPSGDTEAFRAFSQSAPEETPTPSRTPLIIGVAAGAVIVLALLVWLVIG